ncbi:MAG TPA: hypothetical protein PLF11_00160 [Bacillota bacterium]|nr:hypothetical protein [Dermatophilaceae bacterium]HOI35771.1 hypothetical protein [Bacillota bacterium]
MAKDYVYTPDLEQRIKAVLEGADDGVRTGGLPVTWFPDGDDGSEVPLRILDVGDYADYTAQDLPSLCPAILIRGLGPLPYPGNAGIDGVAATVERIRVVHFRMRNQCRRADGLPFGLQSSARSYYAKIIGKALFNDARLNIIDKDGNVDSPTFDSADENGVVLVEATFVSWDLGRSIGSHASVEDVAAVRALGSPVWAIACDLDITLLFGGEADGS